MKQRKINIIVVCVCLLFTGLTRCKTTRNSTNYSYRDDVESVKENLEKNKIDAKTIWIKKYSCEIKENWKRKEFYGDIKIVKGEEIAITVKSGIGIETVRVLLTRDSVKIVDRMKKEVYCGGYEQMEKYFGLINSYVKAEDLLINNNLMVIEELENNEENEGNRYDIKRREQSSELIICETGVKKRKKRFTVEMDNYNVIEYMEKNGATDMVKVEYLNWNNVGKVKFPKEIKIEVHNMKGKYFAIIKYERVEFDKQINTKIKIPVGYKVVNL